MGPRGGGRSFRAFPPAPGLCERCWHEEVAHARDGACPMDEPAVGFGAAGW